MGMGIDALIQYLGLVLAPAALPVLAALVPSDDGPGDKGADKYVGPDAPSGDAPLNKRTLVEITGAVLRNEEGAMQELDLLVAEGGSAAAPALDIRSNLDVLRDLYAADDPVLFARRSMALLDRIAERTARNIVLGPDHWDEAVEDIRCNSGSSLDYIKRLFKEKFYGRKAEFSARGIDLSEQWHDHLSRLNSLADFFKSTIILERLWNDEKTARLKFIVDNMDLSSDVRSRSMKVLLPEALICMLFGFLNVDLQIPSGLRYREGLEVSEFDSVLLELVHNARKYRDRAKKDSFVRISWDAQDKAVIVEDNGKGIADVEAVWGRGVREAERHEGVEGTGLGLASVKGRIERLGWKIDVRSEVGVGTLFTLHPKEGDIIDEASAGGGGGVTGLLPSGEAPPTLAPSGGSTGMQGAYRYHQMPAFMAGPGFQPTLFRAGLTANIGATRFMGLI